MIHDQVQELSTGTWFSLTSMLTLMMIYVAVASWRERGYWSDAAQASVALSILFVGMSLSCMWWWLQAFLPMHGYHDAYLFLVEHDWFLFFSIAVGIVGAVCSIRVFTPMISRKCQLIGRETSWLIPIVGTLLFLLITKHL